MKAGPARRLSHLLFVFSMTLAFPAQGAELSDSLILSGLDGGQLVESELAQGAVVVVVWAGWSPRCRDLVPRVNQIVRVWGDRARIITVNFQEEKPRARAFLRGQESLEAPVFLDEDGHFSRKHRISTLPGLLVLQGGAVTFRGGLPEDPKQVLEAGLGP
jgi:thiol-disulfide isomerase/thioredoxin